MWLCKTCNSRFTGASKLCPLDGNEMEPVEDPLVGRNIGGRYMVGERIGTGGMGTVYRGRHELVGRDVALKFLSPRYASDSVARERFLREARAANRIDHEHIIDITDFGETSDNLVFLVMEFLEGEPLGRIVDKGPMPPVRALTIAQQVAGALARAHELDVIHRDIKPDNIFILQRRGGDYAKLLDFGLARVVGERRLTAMGKVFGTPEYIAPEVARGDTPSGAADQYGLGCVLYEMLTGQLPFTGMPADVLLKHLQETPRAPSTIRPELRGDIDAVVLRMLAKDESGRYGDAFHLTEELGKLIQSFSGRKSAPAGLSSIRAAKPASATRPWVDAAEEAWAHRAAQLRMLIPDAYPAGDVPLEVRAGLDSMEKLVARARQVRAQLGNRVLDATTKEDEIREQRLQLGRAVDELGQDESRAARTAQGLGQQVAEVEAQLEEIGRPVAETWQRLLARIHQSPVLDRGAAELLRQAGGQAGLWMDAESNAETLRGRYERARRDHEDLRFQVSQLKGRIGILTASGEAELAEVRMETDALNAELGELLENLATAAASPMQAMSAKPGMKQRLTAPPALGTAGPGRGPAG